MYFFILGKKACDEKYNHVEDKSLLGLSSAFKINELNNLKSAAISILEKSIQSPRGRYHPDQGSGSKSNRQMERSIVKQSLLLFLVLMNCSGWWISSEIKVIEDSKVWPVGLAPLAFLRLVNWVYRRRQSFGAPGHQVLTTGCHRPRLAHHCGTVQM